jgi:threonine dehydrogenase-like Zn-dependent dehydrogenase
VGYCGHPGKREMADVAAMLAARPEIADCLITHRFSLEDAPDAFRTAGDRHSGAVKVVVDIAS